MKKPREQRILLELEVVVWGMDSLGQLFNIDARTVDITAVGARLDGELSFLQKGAVVGVQCGKSRSRFRVAWVGKPHAGKRVQIGVRSIEPGKYIWGVPLRRQMEVPTEEEPAIRLEVVTQKVSGQSFTKVGSGRE